MSISQADVIKELWSRGELKFKLRGKQVDLYNSCKQSKERVHTICASRRLGKSFVLLTLAAEICIKKPNAIIKYACPTQKQVQEIVRKTAKVLFEGCPPHLQPEWKVAEKILLFPNGSEIQIAATDNGHIDNLRGGSADLCIVDEAGFVDDLRYAIDSVLAPTTDTTDGYVLLASTPNYMNPNHEFNVDYVLPLQQAGTLIKYTIYDSPMLTDERRNAIIAQYGIDNPRFRCEYLCEVAISPEQMVIGEFTAEKEFQVVKENPRPAIFDTYVSMDVGFRDLTGVLFAYYDYLNASIVVEDEYVIRGVELTTDKLAEVIKEKESSVFLSSNGLPVTPTMRIADNNNLILLNDLQKLHGLAFFPTAKDNKDAQINELKLLIKQNRIVINPRCKNLLFHLRAARWNKNFSNFERLKDNKNENLLGGHADLLDALIYLVRNIQKNKNPYPDNYFSLRGSNVFDSFGFSNKNSSVQTFMNTIMGKRDKNKN